MKTLRFLLTLLTIGIFNCSAQNNKIVGSWIYQEEGNTIQYFIKQDGTIFKRKAISGKEVFNSTPKVGTYKFNDNSVLIIKWEDKTSEKLIVKFIDKNAEFTTTELKKRKTYLFLRIIDEEVIEQD